MITRLARGEKENWASSGRSFDPDPVKFGEEERLSIPRITMMQNAAALEDFVGPWRATQWMTPDIVGGRTDQRGIVGNDTRGHCHILSVGEGEKAEALARRSIERHPDGCWLIAGVEKPDLNSAARRRYWYGDARTAGLEGRESSIEEVGREVD